MSKSNVTVSGLRFQKYDSGEIHIHDDSKKIKFISKASDFKNDVRDALKYLKNDGAVAVHGTSKEKLILIKEGKNFSAVVAEDQNISSELNKFVASL
jgi:Ni,Fe-hydrogenase maturation factor